MINEAVLNEENYTARVGFGPRLGAWAIDLGARLIFGSIFGAIAGAAILAPIYQAKVSQEVSGTFTSMSNSSGLWELLGGMVGIVFGIIIFHILIGLMEGFTGVTPGKLMLKLKVAHENGAKPSFGQLLLRALCKYGASVFTLIALLTQLSVFQTIGSVVGLAIFVGFFFILGKKCQGFHDMLSKTSVTKK